MKHRQAVFSNQAEGLVITHLVGVGDPLAPSREEGYRTRQKSSRMQSVILLNALCTRARADCAAQHPKFFISCASLSDEHGTIAPRAKNATTAVQMTAKSKRAVPACTLHADNKVELHVVKYYPIQLCCHSRPSLFQVRNIQGRARYKVELQAGVSVPLRS